MRSHPAAPGFHLYLLRPVFPARGSLLQLRRTWTGARGMLATTFRSGRNLLGVSMDNEDRKRSVSFSMRIPADTDIAIREDQQELCHRDKVSYTMNEVALFLLDNQLYKSAPLTRNPALKGPARRTPT